MRRYKGDEAETERNPPLLIPTNEFADEEVHA